MSEAQRWSEVEHGKMTSAILREAARRSNPVMAAAIMFEALDSAWDYPTKREGLVTCFGGPLLDKLLRAVGEPPSTDAEQRI